MVSIDARDATGRGRCSAILRLGETSAGHYISWVPRRYTRPFPFQEAAMRSAKAVTPDVRADTDSGVPTPPAQHPQRDDILERELDEALEATFPASDPIAVHPHVRAPR